MVFAVTIPIQYLEQITTNRYGNYLVDRLKDELQYVRQRIKTDPSMIDHFKTRIFFLMDKLENHYTCFSMGTLDFFKSVLRPILVVNYVSLYKSIHGHRQSEQINKLRIHVEVELSVVATTKPKPVVEISDEKRQIQLQDEINILLAERLDLLKQKRALYVKYSSEVLVVNQYLEIIDRLDEIEIQLHYLYDEFRSTQQFLQPSQGPPLHALQYHSLE